MAFPQTQLFVETQQAGSSLRWHLVCRIVGAVTAATRRVARCTRSISHAPVGAPKIEASKFASRVQLTPVQTACGTALGRATTSNHWWLTDVAVHDWVCSNWSTWWRWCGWRRTPLKDCHAQHCSPMWLHCYLLRIMQLYVKYTYIFP